MMSDMAPSLSVATEPVMPCRWCGTPAPLLTRQVLLGRYTAAYFRCTQCDLIQTEQPFWLEEAYAAAICASDTGAIARNVLTARLTSAVAKILGLNPQSRFLDFGGGHGVFVRMMRDRGWPFRWFDRYAENLYSAGFESDPSEPSDLVTAFEVFEHLVDVSGDLTRLFAGRPCAVLASTLLHRGHEEGWWYYATHTGQHVAFYSARTMQAIAERFGYRVAGSRAFTLFMRNNVPFAAWRIRLAERLVRQSKGNSTNGWVAALERMIRDFPALTEADCRTARASYGRSKSRVA